MELKVARHRLLSPSLNRASIAALHAALDTAEASDVVRVFVIEGGAGEFCRGMDFAEAAASEVSGAEEVRGLVGSLYDLFDRFTRSPRIVLSMVDGRVLAGGLGLVAAADIALATSRSTFQLSEALFGLLPATVAPFMIRRMGFQEAYRMSVTAERIDAARAAACHLVDAVSDVPDDALRRLLIKVNRIAPADVLAMKAYFRRLWNIDETTREAAVAAITARITDPAVMKGIGGFVASGEPPWRQPSA